ncbi:type IV pilin protein [Noviherbaspirillum agri]
MITVVIIGILASVALPSYQQYVVRSNRAAAQAAMMDIANREQQYLLSNRAFTDSLTTLNYAAPSEVTNKYTVSATGNIELGKYLDASCAVQDDTGTAPSFVISFAPKGSQVSDGTLRLSSTGIKCPAGKW